MTNFNERTNTLLYKNISLTHYSRKGDVCCVWEMSWRRGQAAILTQVLLTIVALLSPHLGLGLLNHGSLRAQSPLSAAGFHFGILSPTDSNRSGTWLYYFLMPTCFRCSSAYLHRCISWLTAWSRVNIERNFFNHPITDLW